MQFMLRIAPAIIRISIIISVFCTLYGVIPNLTIDDAWAQSSSFIAQSPSLEETLRRSFSHGDSAPASLDTLQYFSRETVRYERILVAEFLTSRKSVVAEVELSHRGRSFRFPIKLSKLTDNSVDNSRLSGAPWAITWMPSMAYARRLLELVHGENLPSSSYGTDWIGLYRLPTFPIIRTKSSLITPFGEVMNITAKSLEPPRALVGHFERWVSVILENAPAPASFEIITHDDVSWGHLMPVVFAAASVGLFRVYLAVQGDSQHSELSDSSSGAFNVLAANIPIFSANGMPDSFKPLTLMIHERPNASDGLRVGAVVNGNLIHVKQFQCDDEASIFCLRNSREIKVGLESVLDALKNIDGEDSLLVSHIVLVGQQNTSLNDIISVWNEMHSTTFIAPSKYFLGFFSQ